MWRWVKWYEGYENESSEWNELDWNWAKQYDIWPGVKLSNTLTKWLTKLLQNVIQENLHQWKYSGHCVSNNSFTH